MSHPLVILAGLCEQFGTVYVHALALTVQIQAWVDTESGVVIVPSFKRTTVLFEHNCLTEKECKIVGISSGTYNVTTLNEKLGAITIVSNEGSCEATFHLWSQVEKDASPCSRCQSATACKDMEWGACTEATKWQESRSIRPH